MTFEEAIETEDVEQVKAWIAAGVDVNQPFMDDNGEEDYTPLETAVEIGHLEIVNALLRAGASPHQGEFNLLDIAIANRDVEMVRILLTAGEYATGEHTESFHAAWITAVTSGRLKVVQAFIEAGADVNWTGSQGSALFDAIDQRHPGIAQALIEAGADVDARQPGHCGHDGPTPLMEAARYNLPQLTRLLIESGANLNARDQGGRTPLMIAVSAGSDKVVKVLIERGAKLNVSGVGGRKAFLDTFKKRILGVPHDGLHKVFDLLCQAGLSEEAEEDSNGM
ncbi:MAG: hypothetical protein ETSY1_36265 [Candidatus Entotheonella factor]|uniref:Uncharacterized protein n=1 Tax=Entotheonella factor TaxID=1429438 RepID=W4L8S7_ENTF1|nr:ankyrin repeat domain-containing protein [Candidatus Entotheonella palauensis]ETW94110.1 MAG: hypothetical protein ETSY1_36265 [Candidatus Entotheonella factor]